MKVNGKEFGHIQKLKSLAGEGFGPAGERSAEEQRGRAGQEDRQQTMEAPHPVMRACGDGEEGLEPEQLGRESSGRHVGCPVHQGPPESAGRDEGPAFVPSAVRSLLSICSDPFPSR